MQVSVTPPGPVAVCPIAARLQNWPFLAVTAPAAADTVVGALAAVLTVFVARGALVALSTPATVVGAAAAGFFVVDGFLVVAGFFVDGTVAAVVAGAAVPPAVHRNRPFASLVHVRPESCVLTADAAHNCPFFAAATAPDANTIGTTHRRRPTATTRVFAMAGMGVAFRSGTLAGWIRKPVTELEAVEQQHDDTVLKSV